jgi:hypothetical protein
MAYFDISSMLVALREQPDAFCLSEGWLTHLPSRHRFKVQAEGSIIIDAAGGEACPSVHAEQGRELYQAVGSWRTEYWIPHEIGRHFANHFRPASFWRRWWRKIADLSVEHHHDGAFVLYGKAWADIGLVPRCPDSEPPPSRPAKPGRPPPTSPSANIRREFEEASL